MGPSAPQPLTARTHAIRLVGVIILVLALLLVVVRGAALTTMGSGKPASPDLALLTEVAGTVTGRADVRLAYSPLRDDQRHLIALVDAPADASADITERLSPILIKAAGLVLDKGDTLDVQVFPFAEGHAGLSTPWHWFELGSLLGLLVASAWLLFTTRPRTLAGVAARPANDVTGLPLPVRPAHPPRMTLVRSPHDVEAAAHLAAEDPDQLADTIRQWMADDTARP